MHKDQKRVQEVALPAIAGRIVDDSPAAVRDCIVLNRLLIQGPDPLFLMEACPEEFSELCRGLGITVEDGASAIEKAHWQGPGSLLLGTGLGTSTDFSDVPKEWRQEALWLILASMSDCTEEGYGEAITLVERVRKQARAIGRLSRMAFNRSLGELMFLALGSLKTFIATTKYTVDEKNIAHATEDHAFYVLYKAGFKCVAVHTAGGPIFYGTTPDTSLAECGVTVSKQISPQFGLVFV